MKKNAALLLAALALALALSACGSAAPAAPAEPEAVADMQSVYDSLLAAAELPEMVVVPADRQESLYGIQAADCKQAVTAMCAVSLQADEIWLIEAVDADAAARIVELANSRLEQKKAELENYLPEQFEIVKSAQVITKGNYIAVLVSPNADALAAVVNDAFGIA